MSKELATQNKDQLIESVVIGGDLSKLTPAERMNYYKAVCQSVGLNPLTRPFEYITLNNRLTLYARKDATDQLRNINGVSIGKPDIQFQDEWIIVTVTATDNTGRTDSDVGVVNKKDMRGDFGNALMKAVTKAKRRVTLSICGLGWLDETEIETIPDAQPVQVDDTGEIVEQETPANPPPPRKQKANGNSFAPQDLVDAGIAQNVPNAAQIANKLHLAGMNKPEAIALGKQYRALRDEGLSSNDAAARVLESVLTSE